MPVFAQAMVHAPFIQDLGDVSDAFAVRPQRSYAPQLEWRCVGPRPDADVPWQQCICCQQVVKCKPCCSVAALSADLK